MLTFGSLFSGIEGFGAGFERAGMQCVWQVERDKTCREVLRRHWPDVFKHDDVNEFSAATTDVRPALICGGFPCQDLSVAGKRAGLAGERSGLFHQFMRIVGEFAPRFVVIENVPGLLSSNGGKDMGVVLESLADLGYGFAYRILDAQWFGVAQRRRRVFIVGCLGDWRRAAEILFESESLPWDSAPSREAGARTAACLTSGVANGSGVNRPGRRREDDVNLALCLNAKNGKRYDGESESFVIEQNTQCSTPPLPSLRAHGTPNYGVTHTLRSEGHDASEDGTGRGVPIIPLDMRQLSRGEKMTNNRMDGGPPGTGIGEAGEPSSTVCGSHPPAIAKLPFVFDERNVTSPDNRAACRPDDPVPTMHATPLSVAYAIQERAVSENPNNGPQGKGWQENVGYTLEARHHQQAVATSGVRRLTPRECERLQGFPDDWTRWDSEGKEISDSARYRMLGNAVAVPVAHWIGRRLMAPPAQHTAICFTNTACVNSPNARNEVVSVNLNPDWRM